MKTRKGFVTNSSSSSFVMSFKEKVSDKELEQKILSVFGLSEEHILSSMANDIAKTIVRSLDCAETFTDLETFLDEYYFEGDDEEAQLLATYGNLHIGSWSDDGDDVDRWLCNNDLNYEDDEIVILHDGGY